MKCFNKQPAATLGILIFSIGLMLSWNTFADGGKKATQADLDAEVINQTEAINNLQNQIKNIHLQIDSLQVNATTYKIGDTGPAGGIVFYVTDGGLHGMEASLVDQTGRWDAVEWGCSQTATGANRTQIGIGAVNTSDIIYAGCPDRPHPAHLAYDFEFNGYTDWFLPSLDELKQLHLQKNVVGGFVDEAYWSSSESDYDLAGNVFFLDGFAGVTLKTSFLNVRVIRAF